MSKTIFSFILKHKKTTIGVFLLALIVCAVLSRTVSVNYDMMDYLPEESPSTIALDLMAAEYEGGVPNARVMVYDVTIPAALSLKKQLQAIPGVTNVTWLDDAADVMLPLETIDENTRESYYKNGNALFLVTVQSDQKIAAVNEIDTLIGDSGVLSGMAVDTALGTATTATEVAKIIKFVIPLCFLLLLLTTTSWFEPLLFMLTIGVAILLNQGTNAFFGEISFVTSAAGSILQLAVSMDYSIFLLHRFEECRLAGMDIQPAMLCALQKSVSAIASSGLTTVIGFAALILMRFQIGPDMGYVMAKGIVFSLLSVLILLPVLTILSYRLIDKTHHRSLMPSFQGFAKFVTKIRLPLLILFLVTIVPTYLAQSSNQFYYGASEIFDSETTQVGREKALVEKEFGQSNQMVLLIPKGDFAKEAALSHDLKELPQVQTILSYVDNAGAEIPPEYVAPATLHKLISPHYSRLVLTLQMPYEGRESFDVVQKIEQITAGYYQEYHLAGDTPNAYDLKTVVTEDNLHVNLIAIGAIFLILVLTFRSISLPFFLVLVIETSVWLNLSFPYFIGKPIFYLAYLIISSIQLGATVDYAILLASRYLENRNTLLPQAAVCKTLCDTTLSILTSASILSLGGTMLGLLSSNQVISQLGILVGRGAVLSAFLVLFILPALLYFNDALIQKTTMGLTFQTEELKS